MPNMRIYKDIRPLSEFRANTARLVQQVRETGRPLVLTQHGRGAAVLLNIDEYERLVESAEVLEDIATAEEQIAAGAGVEHKIAYRQVVARLKR